MRRALTVLVAASAVGATGLAGAAHTSAGTTYYGPAAGGGSIWIVVSPAGDAVNRFSAYGIQGTVCTMSIDLTGTYPISERRGSFSIDVDGHDVTGSFTAENTIEGTFELGGNSSCTASATWSATLTDEQAPPLGVGGPPVACRVPRVVGVRLAEARERIRRHNCSVGRIRYTRSHRPRGRVISQRPNANSTLQRRSPVSLKVSRGPSAN
jgi:hypothetical protein